MQPQELIEESWDIKRIIIGIVGLIVVGIGGYAAIQYIPNQAQWLSQKPVTKTVIGAKTEEPPQELRSNQPAFSLPSRNDLNDQLDTIKKQVSGLSLQEVASSSPQVQKVLNDLKALEEYPHNQVKNACLKICNSL